MTSLPLYWSLEADISELAQGNGEKPWQRVLLERQFELVPLDTLSSIRGLSPDDPETDPLEGLERIAIIQPRGLSAADNAALDEWVKAGGQLLILLDPQLTGDYHLALGDPRRPVDMALQPPVIPRWGVVGAYSPALQDVRNIELAGGNIPVWMGSELRGITVASGLNGCEIHESRLISRCESVGEGTVTFLGDAAVFEHPELAGEDGAAIRVLLDFAFQG
ncbi:MAG: hypothetical protein QNJ15_03460 [Erythrobacter sp.]|nr:hypothetical protein [Erythrobacter sp.]